jgi:hypothetical protein
MKGVDNDNNKNCYLPNYKVQHCNPHFAQAICSFCLDIHIQHKTIKKFITVLLVNSPAPAFSGSRIDTTSKYTWWYLGTAQNMDMKLLSVA